MAPSTPNGSSKTQQRPPLPYAHANPFLAMGDTGRVVAVKYQVITRDGQEMLVGRVKIHTPNNGHAFVLRRFDTGAISQTTMFRAAFPGAGEELEKQEAAYIKTNYDSPGANGGPGKENLRLAGNWVVPEVAVMLAPLYSLENPIRSLVLAKPDPNSEYRRSTRPNNEPTAGRENVAPIPAPAPVPVPAATTSTAPQPVPAPVPETPKPAKRRRETSPSPKKITEQHEMHSPTSRRSVRLTSPPPALSPRATRTRTTKTTTTKVTANQPSRATGMLTPGAEEEEEDEDEEVADVPGPDMHADIEAQQELIAKLKAEAQTAENGHEERAVVKREREENDEQLQFNFREPAEEAALTVREIKTNKRLSLDLEPQQKSAAWGALWFATGLAVAATIPSFFI